MEVSLLPGQMTVEEEASWHSAHCYQGSRHSPTSAAGKRHRRGRRLWLQHVSFFFSCALLCSRSCLLARSFVGGRFGSATVSQALSAKHGEPRTHGREEERCGEASSHPRLDLLWCLRPRREIGADGLRLRPTAGTTSCCQWWNAGGGEDLFSRIWRRGQRLWVIAGRGREESELENPLSNLIIKST
jgi:hypothetical protein